MHPARVAIAAALVGAPGCARAPEAPPAVAYDLAERALAADREGPWQLLLFGTPAALPQQAAGFLPGIGRAPFAWARPNAEIRLPPSRETRRALIEMEPHPGAHGQILRLVLGDIPIAQLALAEGRRRYAFELPPFDSGRPLRLEFRRNRAKHEVARGRLAAVLHSLVLGPPGFMQTAEKEAAPPLLAVPDTGARPAILQAGPMRLGYVLAAPERAELRFAHALAAPGRARLRITLDGREQLSARSAAEPSAEVTLKLPVRAGGFVTLGLHVEPSQGEGPVWARWIAPRVLGGAAPDLWRPARDDPGEAVRRRAVALKGALSEANVVLVVLDAAGARHFGCYGQPRATTPEIDRIAGEGVVFANAYTPVVSTLPAMTSLWTSLHPDEHQNLNLRRRHPMNANLPLFAELLAARAGHSAGFVANGVAGPGFGFERGFSEFHELYTSRLEAPRADAFRRVLHPWLRENRGRRFYAYLHFREPHFPYDPPPPFDTRFGPDGPIPKAMRSEPELVLTLTRNQRQPAPGELDHLVRLYHGNLAYADSELGALRRVLEQEGLWERSVVIVTADHGEALGEHGHIGHEVFVYEEEVRIPLIVRFPKAAGVAPRRVTHGFVDLLDIAPTLAEIFGVSAPAAGFRGRSLLSVLAGAPAKRAAHFRDIGEAPWFGVRDDDGTCLYDSGDGVVELYELASDPEQRHDLAPSQPLRAAACRQSLHAWLLGLRAGAAPSLDAQPPGLSPEQRENLRMLGYVQ